MTARERIGKTSGRVHRRSWREKLQMAHRAVADAEADRERVFQQASDAGISVRAIALATGLSSSTAWRYIGRPTEHDAFALLDTEAPDA